VSDDEADLRVEVVDERDGSRLSMNVKVEPCGFEFWLCNPVEEDPRILASGRGYSSRAECFVEAKKSFRIYAEKNGLPPHAVAIYVYLTEGGLPEETMIYEGPSLEDIARDLANGHVCDPLVASEGVSPDDADGFHQDVLSAALREAGRDYSKVSCEKLRELLRRELRALASECEVGNA